ncbi:MAG: DUF2848 family protein, partial [Fimbriimonadaceae bacterium]
EAEGVVYVCESGTWVGVGSDHTDRKLESVGVTLSKQACAKPVSLEVWPMEEIASHWDEIRLESRLADGGIYQGDSVAKLRKPQELLSLYATHVGTVQAGTVMFCGTMPVHGEIRYGADLTLRLFDPVLRRAITHSYSVEELPIAED